MLWPAVSATRLWPSRANSASSNARRVGSARARNTGSTPATIGNHMVSCQHRSARSLKTWVHPDRLMINQWPHQGGDLWVCMILELITSESSCDTSDEIGDLDPRFAAGIDESDIAQLAARLARGVRSCDVG